MANILNSDKQIAVVAALAEGCSIRSIERMTGIHRDTIMHLGVKVGVGCTRLMDQSMRDLPCTRLEMDEVWGFVGKKEKHLKPEDSAELGSVWTFCAIDADTKLVPAFRVGERDSATADAFLEDVAGRMKTGFRSLRMVSMPMSRPSKKHSAGTLTTGRLLKSTVAKWSRIFGATVLLIS